jgi:hypothetical protein
VRTSPFRNAAYSLRCKTEKFEAILFLRHSLRRCLRTADRRAPVPEAAAVHPKCAKLRSASYAPPSRAKADTPRCSANSTSYYRRPRPASCTASRCRRRWHRHCLCRARWRIDRPPRRSHCRRRAGDHYIPVFHEDGFDPGEEASLQIPKMRTRCGSRTGGWSLPCVMSD